MVLHNILFTCECYVEINTILNENLTTTITTVQDTYLSIYIYM